MKKLAVFLCAAAIFSASTASAEPLKKLAKRLAGDLKDRRVAKVAVLAFQYHDGASSSGSSIVQERLTTYLAETGKVEVIERNLIKKLLEERKLELSGVIDPQTTKELGKILGVPVVITGTLNDLPKNETEVNARAVDAESGQILSASKTEIERTWTDAPVKPPAPPRPAEPAPVVSSGTAASGQFLGKPLVQIAVLLDTSNSMDGLINQARTQLWRIVNEFVSSEQKGKSPEIQVALYEYGNELLPSADGYIRQLSPFTSDLGAVSEKLFSLKTKGGDEYCGRVLKEAVEKLAWSPYADVYKAIFIAGNEPFTQGNVDFQAVAAAAVRKGIFVNTIYCGNSQQGIAEQWQAAALAGGGDYSNINQEVQTQYVAAPQDGEISALSAKLAQTRVPMGDGGRREQEARDRSFAMAAGASREAALNVSAYKASLQSAKADSGWDAVAAISSGEKKAQEIKKEDLPEDLRKLSDAERVRKLEALALERKELQSKIAGLNISRQKYLAEQERKASQSAAKTLEKAMLDTIRKQGSQKGLVFKAK